MHSRPRRTTSPRRIKAPPIAIINQAFTNANEFQQRLQSLIKSLRRIKQAVCPYGKSGESARYLETIEGRQGFATWVNESPTGLDMSDSDHIELVVHYLEFHLLDWVLEDVSTISSAVESLDDNGTLDWANDEWWESVQRCRSWRNLEDVLGFELLHSGDVVDDYYEDAEKVCHMVWKEVSCLDRRGWKMG